MMELDISGIRGKAAAGEPGSPVAGGWSPVVRGAPSDALESEERRALLASRARQARGREIGVPHAEAFRRVFGEEP
ncbi:type II toxin-antitoxin system prevent-host-death family antitoxin [Streptomyces calidiresistens]